ncbi:MAG: NAD(P)-dependent alcohol dehydrogenase [Syntrophobacteraceae bacterium]
MSIRTRAAVVSQPGGSFLFQDVELDGPRPGEALVRMIACGICHTDIAARDGLFGQDFPAVFGHEGAGVVESVGAEVSRVRPGERVVISFVSCGKCSNCLAGHPAHCTAFGELNFGSARPDGSSAIHDACGARVGCCFFGQSSFAYKVLARERNLIPVDARDNDELAMFAPLGCGVQAGAATVLNELKPQRGQSFVVFGAGTVGLSALMAAHMAGASPLIAVDKTASRLELATELGATHVLSTRKEEIGSRLRELAGPVDHAVETTGVSRLIDQAIRSLGPFGKMSMLGVTHEDRHERVTPQSPGPNQRVFYSIAGDSDPQEFIPYMIRCYREGKFPFNRLIREYPASEINEAVRDSLVGATIKPLLRF